MADLIQFAKDWRFAGHLNADDGKMRGGFFALDDPWDSQLEFWQHVTDHPRVLALKSRTRGLTTAMACGIGHHLLTTEGASVHIISREETAASDLFQRVKEGLLRLGIVFERETDRVIEFDGKRCEMHPTGRSPARGRYGTLCCIDEWSWQENPEAVFASVLPVAARTWIMFTSAGNAAPSSRYFADTIEGEHPDFTPVFFAADSRMRERAAKSLTRQQLAMEFPVTWEEALASTALSWFDSKDLRDAVIDRQTLNDYAKEPLKTLVSADVARSEKAGADQSVFTVLGQDDEGHIILLEEVVPPRGTKFGEQADMLVQMREKYGPRTPIVIEKSGLGTGLVDAVAERIPERYFIEHNATESANDRGMSQISLAMEQHRLFYSPAVSPLFHSEAPQAQMLKGAHCPDSVASVRNGIQYLTDAERRVRRGQGRLMPPIWVDQSGNAQRRSRQPFVRPAQIPTGMIDALFNSGGSRP